jgi:hypothetical protein
MESDYPASPLVWHKDRQVVAPAKGTGHSRIRPNDNQMEPVKLITISCGVSLLFAAVVTGSSCIL